MLAPDVTSKDPLLPSQGDPTFARCHSVPCGLGLQAGAIAAQGAFQPCRSDGRQGVPLKLLRFVVTLLVALVMGLAFAHVLDRPAKMQYDAATYISLQKSLYVQWGPPQIGGLLEPAAIALTGLLAILLRKRRRDLWRTLAALRLLLMAFPVVFFWLVAPAYVGFAAAALPGIPPDWAALRSNWETGHAIRFVLQFAALALLAWPLAFDADSKLARPKNI
jgi:hypothetical protein